MILVVRRLPLEEAGAFSWQSISPGWFAVAMLLGGLAVVGLAVRWWLYLRVYDLRPRFGEVLRLTLFADFFNFYFLGPLGADGIRLLLLTRTFPQRKGAILGSLMMDHIGGLFSSMVLYVLFARGSGIIPRGVQHSVDVALIIFFIVSCLGLGALMEPWVAHFIGTTRRMTVITRFLAPMFARAPRRHAWLAAGQCASLLSVACGYLAYWAAAQAAHCHATPQNMLGVMPLVDAVASLPITISGLGVRENLLVELLGRQLGIGMTKALAASLLGFGALGLWGLIGGIWLMLWRRRNKPAPPAQPATSPAP
jgi:uncharacterized membrane protein YbhN (UPF0104 family)